MTKSYFGGRCHTPRHFLPMLWDYSVNPCAKPERLFYPEHRTAYVRFQGDLWGPVGDIARYLRERSGLIGIRSIYISKPFFDRRRRFAFSPSNSVPSRGVKSPPSVDHSRERVSRVRPPFAEKREERRYGTLSHMFMGGAALR